MTVPQAVRQAGSAHSMKGRMRNEKASRLLWLTVARVSWENHFGGQEGKSGRNLVHIRNGIL